MIKKEIINGKVFLAQTTYYVYRNEEDYKKDKRFVITSDEKEFERRKEEERTEPHVAEVVKCGQVNKPKPEVTQRASMEFIDLLISHGKISMDKEKIESSKTCEHTNGPEVFSSGYVCTKCGQWINTQND